MLGPGDDDLEVDLAGVLAPSSDHDQHHPGDVVADAVEVLWASPAGADTQ
jgi:hypothetical protein